MMNRSVFYCNYTIGPDAYQDVPAVCRPFGTRILLIGGEKAMAAALPRLMKHLADSGLTLADQVIYGHECTYACMEKWAAHARRIGADMIFGMGGGKALDTAKGAGMRAGLPVFTFPTIAATCAATTALSVVYHEDGAFDSFDVANKFVEIRKEQTPNYRNYESYKKYKPLFEKLYQTMVPIFDEL